MNPRDGRLDPRAWLLWGIAATLPALTGRNPFVLLATLLAVLAVRAAWVGRWAGAETAPNAGAWRVVIRLAALFAAVGVLFNVLTVHAGDRVLARLPDAWPIVGGPLTLNAVVYGMLSGLAILTLVLVGTTLGAVLDAAALLRLLPPRLTVVAVAGSVAWAFVPQTAIAFGEIRDAQAARGFRPRGLRDLLPLVVPLLAGGLDRAVTMAEALESRGFGATAAPDGDGGNAARRGRAVVTCLGLAAAAGGAYLLAVGRVVPALLAMTIAIAALLRVGRGPNDHPHPRTRYRPAPWTRPDTLVCAAAALVLLAQLATLRLRPSAFAYEPYPSLSAPRVDLLLLAALTLLLAPAGLAPVAVADGDAAT